jgi:hypothetical protein
MTKDTQTQNLDIARKLHTRLGELLNYARPDDTDWWYEVGAHVRALDLVLQRGKSWP